jgi:hypothetical protein
LSEPRAVSAPNVPRVTPPPRRQLSEPGQDHEPASVRRAAGPVIPLMQSQPGTRGAARGCSARRAAAVPADQRRGTLTLSWRQCLLVVEAVRVGSLALPAHAFLTPRSLVPPAGGLSEPAAVQRISGLVVEEWFQFVRREKQARPAPARRPAAAAVLRGRARLRRNSKRARMTRRGGIGQASRRRLGCCLRWGAGLHVAAQAAAA